MQRGDAEARDRRGARAGSSGRMRIGGQEHFYLEGQVALAVPGEDDEVTGLLLDPAPERDPAHGRARAGRADRTPSPSRCRRMGGGFGGKETQAQPVRLRRRARRQARPAAPPRCRLDRDDDMIDHRQAPRLRRRLRGRLRRRRPHPGRRHRPSPRAAAARPTSPAPVTDRALFHADNAYCLPGGRAALAAAARPTPSPTPPSAASAARRAWSASSA